MTDNMRDILLNNHVNGVLNLPKCNKYGTEADRNLDSVIKGLFGVQRLTLDEDFRSNNKKSCMFTDECTTETLQLLLVIRATAAIALKNMLIDADLKEKLLNGHFIRVFYSSPNQMRTESSFTPAVQICPVNYLSDNTVRAIEEEAASTAPSIWIMAGFGRHDGTSTYRLLSIQAIDDLTEMPEQTRELPSKLQILNGCSRCGTLKMQRPCPACRYTHFCLDCWKSIKHNHHIWLCQRIQHMMTQPSNEDHLYI